MFVFFFVFVSVHESDGLHFHACSRLVFRLPRNSGWQVAVVFLLCFFSFIIFFFFFLFFFS